MTKANAYSARSIGRACTPRSDSLRVNHPKSTKTIAFSFFLTETNITCLVDGKMPMIRKPRNSKRTVVVAPYSLDEKFEVLDDFVQPPLFVPLVGRFLGHLTQGWTSEGTVKTKYNFTLVKALHFGSLLNSIPASKGVQARKREKYWAIFESRAMVR